MAVTIYTEELGQKMFLLFAEGQSIRSICSMADMPCRATIFNWMGQSGHPILDIVTRGRMIGRISIADRLHDNSILVAALNSKYDPRRIDVANRGLKMYLDVTAPKKDWGESEEVAGVLEVPAICESDEEMVELEAQEIRLLENRRKVKNLAQEAESVKKAD